MTDILQGLGPLRAGPAQGPWTVALVGGGGKSTLLFALAHALAAEGLRVITTCTTHMFPPQAAQSPQLLLASDFGGALPREILCAALGAREQEDRAPTGGHCTLALAENKGKLQGLSFAQVDALRDMCRGSAGRAPLADVILVEADGAAMRPLKAPAAHEPAVPPATHLCVAVLGLDGLGQAFDLVVHRPALGLALCDPDFSPDSGPIPASRLVGPADLAHLALHPQGLFRSCPAHAQKVVFCNKADLGLPPPSRAAGSQTSPLLCACAHAAALAQRLYPQSCCPWYGGSALEGWVRPLTLDALYANLIPSSGDACV